MSLKNLQSYGPFNYFYNVKDQMQRHIYDRSIEAFRKGDAARDAIASVEALEAHRSEMRKLFIESLGGLPSFDTPLNPRITGVIGEKGFKIEKIIFESRPGAFVTANLYIPDGLTEPSSAVQFLCGHHIMAKHQQEYQRVCRFLAKAGLIVLAQDPIGQGERHSYFDKCVGANTVGCCCPEHDYAGGQAWALGDTIARYFVHDSMRGIDYLCSRTEVDPNRIGVTGNSGGGTQTSMMMMCDPRIAAAAPTTFIMDRETYMYSGGAQDAEQIWPAMTSHGWDHEDILIMLAPKPVKVLSVKYDFFPIDGTRRTVERAKRSWELYGKPENISLTEDATTHWYSDVLATAAAEFFSEHLNGHKVTPKASEITAVEPSRLWCTDSGQVQCEITGARFVYEENCDRLKELEAKRVSTDHVKCKQDAIDWLKSAVYKDRKTCDTIPRLYITETFQEYRVEMAVWWSQLGVMNHGFLFKKISDIGKTLPVTVAVWEGGTTQLEAHADWLKNTTESGRAVLVLDTTGVGNLEPYPLNHQPVNEFYGVIHKFNDDLLWLDDCIPALRTFDVTRCMDAISDWPELDSSDVKLYGHGKHSVYAQLAYALGVGYKGLELEDAFTSYAQWVKERHYNDYDIRSIIFRGILQHTDLPELLESK